MQPECKAIKKCFASYLLFVYLLLSKKYSSEHPLSVLVQSPGAVEYTNCIYGDGYPPHLNRCPRYDTKPSDSEAPVLEHWGM